MHKKRGRGRGRAYGEGIEHDSLLQPCCIEGCDRYGTRLLSSLRDNYQLKDNHSGRVCEGHYRRDLRSFKRKHTTNFTPNNNLKKPVSILAASPLVNSTRKYQVSSMSSPPRVIDEPPYNDHVPQSYVFRDEVTKKIQHYHQNVDNFHQFSSEMNSYYHSQYNSYTEEPYYGAEQSQSENENHREAYSNTHVPVTIPKDTLDDSKTNGSQIFMEVEEYDDDDDDEMPLDNQDPTHRKLTLPSISQLYSTPSPTQIYQPNFATYQPTLQVHCAYSQPATYDTKFKEFCEFVLKSESVI